MPRKSKAVLTAQKVSELIDRTAEAKASRRTLKLNNALEYDIVYNGLRLLKDVIMAETALEEMKKNEDDAKEGN